MSSKILLAVWIIFTCAKTLDCTNPWYMTESNDCNIKIKRFNENQGFIDIMEKIIHANTDKKSIFYLENSHKIRNNTVFFKTPLISFDKFPTCNIHVIVTTRNEASIVDSYFELNPDLLKEQIPTIITIQFEYPKFSWDIRSLAYYFVPIRAIFAQIDEPCIKAEKNCIPLKWMSYCHWCATKLKDFPGRDNSILKILKFWDIQVKDRAPLFQITSGGSNQQCKQSNYINLGCNEHRRYYSTLEEVFNFSIVYNAYDPSSEELNYRTFSVPNSVKFSNSLVYLEYDGWH